jgi:ATP-dependent Clp protease ATP-binding subunit ClpC
MFERFTDQSRRAVVLAQEEARRLNHNHIGTEHLLAGLRHEDRGPAARALKSADITLDAVRAQIGALAERGQLPSSGHIPFTLRAKKGFELALREALQLDHDFISTGHLLLGLVSQDDCMAVQVLGELGADLEQLRARVIIEIEDHPEDQGYSPPLRPGHAQLPDAVRVLLDTIDGRLSAIERRLGMAPGVPDEIRGYDEQIARVRREKEEAIESQDFAKAAALRDKERELLAERARATEGLTAGREAGGQADAGNGSSAEG